MSKHTLKHNAYPHHISPKSSDIRHRDGKNMLQSVSIQLPNNSQRGVGVYPVRLLPSCPAKPIVDSSGRECSRPEVGPAKVFGLGRSTAGPSKETRVRPGLLVHCARSEGPCCCETSKSCLSQRHALNRHFTLHALVVTVLQHFSGP
jgi:hypothetical protein